MKSVGSPYILFLIIRINLSYFPTITFTLTRLENCVHIRKFPIKKQDKRGKVSSQDYPDGAKSPPATTMKTPWLPYTALSPSALIKYLLIHFDENIYSASNYWYIMKY